MQIQKLSFTGKNAQPLTEQTKNILETINTISAQRTFDNNDRHALDLASRALAEGTKALAQLQLKTKGGLKFVAAQLYERLEKKHAFSSILVRRRDIKSPFAEAVNLKPKEGYFILATIHDKKDPDNKLLFHLRKNFCSSHKDSNYIIMDREGDMLLARGDEHNDNSYGILTPTEHEHFENKILDFYNRLTDSDERYLCKDINEKE